jgi:hypothetical protein
LLVRFSAPINMLWLLSRRRDLVRNVMSATSVLATAATTREALSRLGLRSLPTKRHELKQHFVSLAKKSHPDTAAAAVRSGGASGARSTSAGVDMAQLSESYKALSALYSKESGELAPEAHLLLAHVAGSGAAMSAHGFAPLGADPHAVPRRASAEEVGTVWFPWLKGKPKSLARAEDQERDASFVSRTADRSVAAAAAAATRVSQQASRLQRTVRYIVTGT